MHVSCAAASVLLSAHSMVNHCLEILNICKGAPCFHISPDQCVVMDIGGMEGVSVLALGDEAREREKIS